MWLPRNILMVALLFILGCSKPKAELTIPEEEFVKVLADAHLIESALSTNYGVIKDSLTQLYYSQLYEIHGIDETSFRSNLAVLETDPKLMKAVYAKVMDHLSKLEANKKGEDDKQKKSSTEKPKNR